MSEGYSETVDTAGDGNTNVSAGRYCKLVTGESKLIMVNCNVFCEEEEEGERRI